MTATELLDGTIPQRSESIVWNLHDKDDNLLGTLMVDREDVPSLRNDTKSSIRRSISNLRIPPRPLIDVDPTHYYAADLNTLTMRVRPWWIVGEVQSYPLGLFVFADDSAEAWSWGNVRHITLADRMTDLDQPLEYTIGYQPGTSITVALAQQCDAEAITADKRLIDSSSLTIADPIAWVAGRDSRLTVMESLCALAGFLPPYFNNSGILVCRTAPNLTTATADFTYGPNTVVLNGSVLSSNDLLTAPNRYVVISSASPDVEITGTFDVPDAAPHSFFNTGRIRRRTIDLQGITDTAAANQAAAAAYAADSSTYSWLSFETPPDPRHDTFDTIQFDGVNYRQLAWTLECKHGGRMSHDCRGIYA